MAALNEIRIDLMRIFSFHFLRVIVFVKTETIKHSDVHVVEFLVI